MKFFIGFKNAILFSIPLYALNAYGCASLGSFTPAGGAVASAAVSAAQGLMHSLDSFYGDLVDLKMAPDHTVQATRALAMSDMAATTLKAVIAGATVSDAKLNVAAGQVDGAKAILEAAK